MANPPVKKLLDANKLITAFDTGDEALKQEIIKDLENDAIGVAITPLIRYEVLRGLKTMPYETMKAILDEFVELEVRRQDAELAAQIFAYHWVNKKNKEENIDKRTFDLMHYVCAFNNGFDLSSNDGGFSKAIKPWHDSLLASQNKDTPHGT